MPCCKLCFGPKKKQAQGCLFSGDAKLLWNLWLGRRTLPPLLRQVNIFAWDNGSGLPETLRVMTVAWLKKPFIHPGLTFPPQDAQAVAGPHGWFLPRLPLPAALPSSSSAPSASPGSLKHIFVQTAGLRQGEQGSWHAGTQGRGTRESGTYMKANTPVPIVAKQGQLCPRIKSNAKSSRRNSTRGKGMACKGISICSHLGETAAALSAQGPQQITLCKHSNSLPHHESCTFMERKQLKALS